MRNIIYAAVFLLLSFGGIVVRKTYFRLPVRELKRRAEKHDRTAQVLYRAVAYGNSLRGLLWLYIGLMSAVGLILLARELSIWVSLALVGPLLWIAFSLIPASRTTRLGTWLAMMVTPPIAWLLNYLHPILSRGADTVERRYTVPDHTRLFEREDLIRLLERQRNQEDSRFTQEELEIAIRALSFDDHLVADIMTPRRKIKTVKPGDTIGPILIDELHKNGQEQVLVRETAKGPFVGNLRLNQLNIRSEGKVGDIMTPTVYYVHENDTLGEALHAFFTTNHPVFVVINRSEEYVGVISAEDIIRQLVGHVPGDEFDQYSDPEAVAARHPAVRRKDGSAKTEPDTPVKTDEEVVE
ncbi:MAG TPA: CBS domain-containing protein [Candidatus Saccharimonadales bacterium]|nr:CBS domain-containing protein [Candidatus Saccharimonadales bacterium]